MAGSRPRQSPETCPPPYPARRAGTSGGAYFSPNVSTSVTVAAADGFDVLPRASRYVTQK